MPDIDSVTIIRELGINAGLIALLAVVYGLTIGGSDHADERIRALRSRVMVGVCGLLFGLVAVIAMNAPLRIAPGVIVDSKTIIMALAGAFLPAWPAALCVAIGCAYRLYLGGLGAWAGMGVMVGAALAGWLMHRARPAFDRRWRGFAALAAWLAVFGLLVALSSMLASLLLPVAMIRPVIERSFVPVFVIFPLGVMVFGTLFDGSLKMRQRERALREALADSRRAASVFLNSRDSIAILDAQGTLLDANPMFCTMTGFARSEVLGQDLGVLRLGQQAASFLDEIYERVRLRGHWQGEVWSRRKGGEIYPADLSVDAVFDASGAVLQQVVMARDLSDRRRHEEELLRAASFDALTGLPNRRLFTQRLRQAMADGTESGHAIAVCYIDIDRFALVNDAHGQEVGDAVILQMAARLSRELLAGETVARLGGDEFVLALCGVREPAMALLRIEALRAALAQPLSAGSTAISVTASVGVTFHPADRGDADALLRHADQALYSAKELGKDRIHVFDAQRDARAQARRETLVRIEQAIDSGEMELFYQPKVRLADGAVHGAEALIRWRHPERGLLAPGAFLDELLGTPVANKLDDWVFREGLRQCHAWHVMGLSIPVSVNMAVSSLVDAGFLDRLQRQVAEHPSLPAGVMEVELLETEMLSDFALVASSIEQLRGSGVRCAIDDFGTGYSSLSYLQRLPAQTIKIDQSFVRDMLGNEGDRALVQGVIGLARAFGRDAVAEGVETAAHIRLLTEMGCPVVQGYGIARPMPAADVPTWVRGWSLPRHLAAQERAVD